MRPSEIPKIVPRGILKGVDPGLVDFRIEFDYYGGTGDERNLRLIGIWPDAESEITRIDFVDDWNSRVGFPKHRYEIVEFLGWEIKYFNDKRSYHREEIRNNLASGIWQSMGIDQMPSNPRFTNFGIYLAASGFFPELFKFVEIVNALKWILGQGTCGKQPNPRKFNWPVLPKKERMEIDWEATEKYKETAHLESEVDFTLYTHPDDLDDWLKRQILVTEGERRGINFERFYKTKKNEYPSQNSVKSYRQLEKYYGAEAARVFGHVWRDHYGYPGIVKAVKDRLEIILRRRAGIKAKILKRANVVATRFLSGYPDYVMWPMLLADAEFPSANKVSRVRRKIEEDKYRLRPSIKDNFLKLLSQIEGRGYRPPDLDFASEIVIHGLLTLAQKQSFFATNKVDTTYSEIYRAAGLPEEEAADGKFQIPASGIRMIKEGLDSLSITPVDILIEERPGEETKVRVGSEPLIKKIEKVTSVTSGGERKTERLRITLLMSMARHTEAYHFRIPRSLYYRIHERNRRLNQRASKWEGRFIRLLCKQKYSPYQIGTKNLIALMGMADIVATKGLPEARKLLNRCIETAKHLGVIKSFEWDVPGSRGLKNVIELDPEYCSRVKIRKRRRAFRRRLT